MSAVALAHAPVHGRDRTAQLVRRVEELEEELRQLRAACVPPVAFPSSWRLTPSETATLAAFFGAKGGICTRQRLWTVLYAHRNEDEQPDPKILDVLVCHLRRKLMQAQARITIETSWGRGWLLTPDSLARLQEIAAGVPELDQRKAG